MARFDGIPLVTGEWECMECGFIEEGTESRRPKACPECEAPASALEFFPYDEDKRDQGSLDEDDDYEELDEEDEYEEEEG